MKIVFAASEAAPFVKTGGLGDVAQALPEALSKVKGNEIILFVPYYGKIKYNNDIKTEYITSFSVDLSWRKQHVGIFKYKSKKRKLQVYFIDNEYYFGREREYGYYDDGERYAYFSKAMLEAMVYLKIKPDVIHCNDWQTAMVPVFLHEFYHESLGSAKTVFTIHNIEYQGKADPYFLGDTLGLPDSYESTLAYDGCVNVMKGAILTTDALTTVSKTYADEIKYPYYAHGLAPVISDHAFKLCGIVNGINTASNDPATDPHLPVNYTSKDVLVAKAANKESLQKELGLEVRADVPVIGMVSRLVSHKGMELICQTIDELMQWDVQLVILGTGDPYYENCLREYADTNKDKFSLNLCFNSALASKIYGASDLYLMPSKSEPCGLSQLIAMRYGTVPIVNATGGLRDTVEPYNEKTGEGTGFNFQSFVAGDMLDAINRALNVYNNDKNAWSQIINNGMNYPSSWDKPAVEYMALYESLIKE